MTPWTIDQQVLTAAGVTLATTGDIGAFTWGASPATTTVKVQVQGGVANFFPERSAQQQTLMAVLGLLTP